MEREERGKEAESSNRGKELEEQREEDSLDQDQTSADSEGQVLRNQCRSGSVLELGTTSTAEAPLSAISASGKKKEAQAADTSDKEDRNFSAVIPSKKNSKQDVSSTSTGPNRPKRRATQVRGVIYNYSSFLADDLDDLDETDAVDEIAQMDELVEREGDDVDGDFEWDVDGGEETRAEIPAPCLKPVDLPKTNLLKASRLRPVILDLPDGRKAQHQKNTCEVMHRSIDNRHLPLCSGCRLRQHYCAFKNFRAFVLAEGVDSEAGYTKETPVPRTVELVYLSTSSKEDEFPYPDPKSCFFRPLLQEESDKMMLLAAENLSVTMKEATRHASLPNAVHRPAETSSRQTCDLCKTSIFAIFWMCTQCGRDACLDCFDKLQELEKGETSEVSGHFFKNCQTRKIKHRKSNFMPITAYGLEDMLEESEAMEELIENSREKNNLNSPDSSSSNAASSASSNGPVTPEMLSSSLQPDVQLSPEDSDKTEKQEVERELFSSILERRPELPPTSEPPLTEATPSNEEVYSPGWAPELIDHHGNRDKIGSHKLAYYSKNQNTPEIFRRLWALGEPIVLSDVQVCTESEGSKVGHPYTASDFYPYRDENCKLLSSEYTKDDTDDKHARPELIHTTLGKFMSTLGQDDETKRRILGRDGSFKLKVSGTTSGKETCFERMHENKH